MTSIECGTDARRAKIRAAHHNGVDEVEVSDNGLELTVTFLGRAPEHLHVGNIRIDGGRRITGIKAVHVELHEAEDPELDDHLHVTLDRKGDTSTYTLSVVEQDAYGRPSTTPYHGFDPRYDSAPFSFMVNCPTDFDCADGTPCPPPTHAEPTIDYLARDYDSIRRLLLDRMTLVAPNWVERHEPDIGVALVELLAYVGDQFSYQQDAVATEAYLDTARLRQSVRRHVRLIDYAMHDGCNARTWVVIGTDAAVTLPAGGFRFAAIDVSMIDPRSRPDLGAAMTDGQLMDLPATAAVQVFEPLESGPVTLYPGHDSISFWTWGEQECCLLKGATSATLADGSQDSRVLNLVPGDVLLIEEVIGPRTGAPADADPTHRQAVRITGVQQGEDELYEQPVLEVSWAPEDALTFAVCLSARGGPDCALLTDVSVARGNVVLVDHGRDITFCGGDRETIPVPVDQPVAPTCGPPAFGCPDRQNTGPAVTAIHTLLAQARSGVPLSADQIAELVPLLGQAAVDRSALTVDLPAAGQAAALEALLAQVTYPPIPNRFQPILLQWPVTQRAMFPDPVRMSAAQAMLLSAIPGQVTDWLHQLWLSVQGGHKLTGDEIRELMLLLGRRRLEDPVEALNDLVTRFDELLATKLARLAALAARAASGEVLGPEVVWEIEQTWGARYGVGLAPGSPGLAGPASVALQQDPRAALPDADLTGTLGGQAVGTWLPHRDLLAAGPRDRWFIGEMTDDGTLALRFGDGQHGTAPPAGGDLLARYRVGNGTIGNVGAEAITHLVLCSPVGNPITVVRNPLPATGGTDPEPVDQVRQLAPLALHRTRLRAITAADYAELAGQVFGVRRTAAEIRWTGAAEEVHVAIEGAGQTDQSLLDAVDAVLQPYRRIGHLLSVLPAELVPLDLEVTVCVAPGFQQGHVTKSLHTVLGSGTGPDGTPGFFNPAVLDFGEPVRVSRIIAAASTVPGVISVRVTRLKRLFGPAAGELAAGLLTIGPLEIAQLDDDPDRPENGRLTVVLGGGR